jgi:integrase/recombinase XerD
MILAQPDLSTVVGMRDRTVLELIYPTGARRMEACELAVTDRDPELGTLRIRHGKGNKERYVPIGKRALFWVSIYVNKVRPELARFEEASALFLSADGTPLDPDSFGQRVRRYVKDSGVGTSGGCHLFRHTMAADAGGGS